MKTILLIALCALACTFTVNATVTGPDKDTENPSKVSICATIKGKIGKQVEGAPVGVCKGLGLRCLSVEFDVVISDVAPQAGAVKICITMNSRTAIQIDYVADGVVKPEDFEVETPRILDPKLAKALGYNSVQLLPGKYKTTKLADGRFSTVIPVNSK